jgi:DNA-binding XRE family transcriptional regulator
MRKKRSDAARIFYVAVGRNIADLRRRQKLTQDALAQEVSLTRTSIVNIEKGKQQLLLHTLVQIAHALKAEPAELIPADMSTYQPAVASISHFVEDPSGRAWIETSIRKYGAS